MPDHRRRTPLPVSARELYDWHARPGAFERLTPPFEPVRVESWRGGVATRGRPEAEQWGDLSDGAEVSLAMKQGPLTLRWLARHEQHVEGEQFVDRQVSGPFARWVHTHRFEAAGPDRSVLDDHVDYALPLGPLGRLFGGGFAARKLERLFAFRHRRTRDDLVRHAAFAHRPRMRIAVTGASGLVGRALVAFLRTGGHEVHTLVRGEADPARQEISWSPAEGRIDAAALEGLDAVVHLAGESIQGRWTEAKKARIRGSRVDGTTLLAEALAGLQRPPQVLVQASAIGVYGDRGDEPLTERSPTGAGFLAEVGRAWEGASQPATGNGVRVVHVRFGVILTPAGGALAQMLLPFRLGLGGPIGTGRQWMSWIALDDAVGLLHHAIMTKSLAGPVNATAPNPVQNRDFGRALGRALGRPAVAPLPGPVVKLLFGEMGEALLLEGQRVLPEAALESGFDFRYPHLDGALAHLLGNDSTVPVDPGEGTHASSVRAS